MRLGAQEQFGTETAVLSCIIFKRLLKSTTLWGALKIRLLFTKALSGILNIHEVMTDSTMLIRAWVALIET